MGFTSILGRGRLLTPLALAASSGAAGVWPASPGGQAGAACDPGAIPAAADVGRHKCRNVWRGTVLQAH